MKCLVTGVAGFVGSWLLPEISPRYREIYGLTLGDHEKADCTTISCDIRNQDNLDKIIRQIKPDSVFHLAAQPFVPIAMKNPQETMDINVKGTLNLLESLHKLSRPVSFLYISSADVYGNQAEENLPLKETCSPMPLNPYSFSKRAAEEYALGYARYSPQINVKVARPFNHIGVGQRGEFVIPNFIKQVISLEREGNDIIKVGNLESTRDFLDVRDVVRAYSIIDEKGKSGEIYNICSGKEVTIRTVLQEILKHSSNRIKIEIDPERLRNAETSRLFGSNTKISALGWKQEISLEDSIGEIYSSFSRLA